MWELWMANMRSLAGNSPTWTRMHTRQSFTSTEERPSKRIFYHRNTTSLITKSSVLITKISQQFSRSDKLQTKTRAALKTPKLHNFYNAKHWLRGNVLISWKRSIKGNKIGRRASLSSFLPGRLPALGWVLQAPSFRIYKSDMRRLPRDGNSASWSSVIQIKPA